MSKETESPKPFKPDKVSRAKMASYGMGPFAQSFIYAAYNLLVFYYYQVELGLSTALVGLSFVIYALWNMINDPLVGYLTDKPNRWSQKYGLRAPWIIIAGIFQAVLWYFLFFIPFDVGDVKSNPWPLFWYMVAITCAWDTAFSLFTTHYIGGFANIFRTADERRKGSTTMILVGILGQTFNGVIVPLMIVLGDPSSYVRTALICAIVLLIALILFIPGVYENEFVKKRYLQIYEFLEKQKMGYFKTLKIAFKQKNWTTWLVGFTLWTIGLMLGQVSNLYFAIDVLGLDISTLAWLAIPFLLSFFPFIFIWSYLAKKTDHVNISITAMFIVIFVRMFAFFFVVDITGLIIVNILSGIASSAWASVLFSITGDCNDEVTLAAGRHVEATIIGIRNFFLRIAYLVIGVIIAGVQIATGYQPGAAEQTELAKWGIRIHTMLIPALFTLAGAIIMLKFYDLKGEKKIAQMAALRKKKL